MKDRPKKKIKYYSKRLSGKVNDVRFCCFLYNVQCCWCFYNILFIKYYSSLIRESQNLAKENPLIAKKPLQFTKRNVSHLFIVLFLLRCVALLFVHVSVGVFGVKKRMREYLLILFLVPTHSNGWAHLFNKQNRQNACSVKIMGYGCTLYRYMAYSLSHSKSPR